MLAFKQGVMTKSTCHRPQIGRAQMANGESGKRHTLHETSMILARFRAGNECALGQFEQLSTLLIYTVLSNSSMLGIDP